MNYSYHPEAVSQHFDEFGVQEWDRLVRTPADEVSFHIHMHYLKKYISPGQKVLEIGAGPGRFTQVLAELGAHISVADISKVQLDLNRQFAHEYDFHRAVREWRQADICDLSCYQPGTYDCIVAYGGPFSYVLDQRDIALAECLRVLRPGGVLLLSVMSLWGTVHGFLEGVLSISPEVNQRIIASGDITPATYPERQSNFMHLFRAQELLAWLQRAGLTVLDKSASQSLSLAWAESLKQVRQDAEKWGALLGMELEACADENCLGMGTHIIAVVKNR